MSKLSIIVPVYWNSDTLMLLYEDMKEKILHKLEDYEIVFVDDGSGDNSWEIMNQIRDMDDLIGLLPRLFTAKATTGVSGASLLLQEVPAGSWSHLIYVSGEQQAETEQLSSIGRLTALVCGEQFNEKDYAAQLSELEL